MPKPQENREVRETVEGLELRASSDGKGPGTMTGYAAVFNKFSVDLGYFREKIAPGAFAKALAKSDVRALFNHDPDSLLGRSSAGTLRLSEDETGLRVEIDLPDTQLGRDVAELIRRRDLQGQSFSFTTSVDQWDRSSDPALRTLIEVDELFDVGPVTFPAYEETSVAMRSWQQGRAEEGPVPTPEPDPEPEPDHSLEIEQERDSARLRLLEV